MSVTFSLPREFCAAGREAFILAFAQPCPECGGHNPYAQLGETVTRVEPSLECRECYGHGGDSAAEAAYYDRQSDEDGEFNVANGNAAYIVQDLLNLPCDEVHGGALDPSTVLLRLATAFDTSGGVEEPSETQAVRLDANGVGLGCRVINCGRTQSQIDSYVSRLRRLAELAVERGAPEIVWG